MGLWKWYCCGKHPVVADFFQVGEKSALAERFSRWVEEGYAALIRQKSKRTGISSWRFWTQGSKNGELVLGLIRDSGDSRGRPFPILFLGSGPLTSWARIWELLPLTCDQAWGHIEHLAVKRLESLQELKDEVRRIRPPLSEWAATEAMFNGADHTADGERIQDLERDEPADPAAMHFQVPLHEEESAAHLLASCHSRLKRLGPAAVPQAVFMGGSEGFMHLKGYFRSLKPSDFVTLWSLR